jgi:methionine-rich copper-binding protein CopC
VSTVPANNATNISINTAITATVSEALDATTVNGTNVYLRAGATTIAATLSYTPGTTVITLTPSAALSYSTTYTATIKGGATGIKDVAGNALASDYGWSFTTAAAPDVAAPTVVSTVPVNNATNISITAAITATVSEALDAATVNSTNVLLQAGAMTIAATLSYVPGTTVITLTPTAALSYSTTYTATVKGGTTGIKDVAGNTLAADFNWSFTTAPAPDVTAPTVVSTVPANNATGVATTTAVTVNFSESLNATTVNGTNVYLRAGATAVPATVSYIAGSTSVNLVPSSALAAATIYTVTLKGGSAGIKDIAGNALATDYAWSFTTETPPVNNGNDIVAENALPGTPSSEWDVSGAGDPSIQGFATDMSVNRGSIIRFKINVTGTDKAFGIRIYRLGYYNGNGARLVADLGSFTGVTQPSPTRNDAIGLVDYGTWSESASWAVPSNAVSGVYIAKLTRTGTGGASHIVFVVRNDASTAPILFKTSDATWQAYNSYGGYSFYGGSTSNINGRADKLSYNRPFNTRDVKPECYLFNAEYPMLRWMERNGYHMTYTTDVDMERNTTLITPSKHQVMLSIGHD